MAGSLEGQVILITGASSGIGEATARTAVAAGARVVLAARRTERLRKLCDELGPNAAWRETDVGRRADLEALAALAVERFGRIDALVSNAGVMPASMLSDGRVDEWDRMIDVNLKGVLYGVHAVLNRMLAQNSGHLLFIASVAALSVTPASSVYSATKAAMKVIAEGLRQELADTPLRVTTIYPGFVATELAESVGVEAIRERARTRMAGGMSPQVIADAIVYALSQPPTVAVSEIVVRPIGPGI